jgi:DNA-directed RNA polymerase specialized sigma24 family protein
LTAFRKAGYTHAWKAKEADSTYDAQRLAFWSDVHAAANDLDLRLRDVVDLVWYHDLTQAEVARVLSLPATIVNSRWQAARLELMAIAWL